MQFKLDRRRKSETEADRQLAARSQSVAERKKKVTIQDDSRDDLDATLLPKSHSTVVKVNELKKEILLRTDHFKIMRRKGRTSTSPPGSRDPSPASDRSGEP